MDYFKIVMDRQTVTIWKNNMVGHTNISWGNICNNPQRSARVHAYVTGTEYADSLRDPTQRCVGSSHNFLGARAGGDGGHLTLVDWLCEISSRC